MSIARALFFGGVFLLGAACAKFSEPSATTSGTIETDESRLASRHGGRVEEIFVHEGDTVQTNQLLIRLAAPELAARRAEMVAMLTELKNGPRKEELAAALAESEAIAAELEFARSEERRMMGLTASGAVAATDRERAVSRAANLEKSLAASKARHQLLVAGTRPERIAQVEAQVAEIDTEIRELEIRAPAPAVVETLHVKVGDVPGPNTPVATLLLTSHLWVRVYVPEPWLGRIKVGDKVRVQVDSFPGKDFPGEVEQIARAAEFTPRNVQTAEDRVKQVFGVKVRLPSDNPELRAGMSADVFFQGLPPKKP